MPTLTVVKTYTNDTVLTEDNLDDIKDSIETFINVTKLGSDNLQANSVTTDQLASTSVTTSKIANGAVTDTKIGNSASDDSLRAVSTNAIKDAAVTTPKIADGSITLAKLITSITQALVPPGTIHAWGGRTEAVSVPAGYFYCDGSAISRTTYAALFAVIGTNFGYGDQSTTFNLPDTRGFFLRGINDQNDVGQDGQAKRQGWLAGSSINSVGSYEPGAFQDHTHSIQALTPNSNLVGTAAALGGIQTIGTPNGNVAVGDSSSGSTLHQLTIPTTTGNNNSASFSTNYETRPVNMGVNYIIKY